MFLYFIYKTQSTESVEESNSTEEKDFSKKKANQNLTEDLQCARVVLGTS